MSESNSHVILTVISTIQIEIQLTKYYIQFIYKCRFSSIIHFTAFVRFQFIMMKALSRYGQFVYCIPGYILCVTSMTTSTCTSIIERR